MIDQADHVIAMCGKRIIELASRWLIAESTSNVIHNDHPMRRGEPANHFAIIETPSRVPVHAQNDRPRALVEVVVSVLSDLPIVRCR
jgi:hypothetical protein